MVPFDVTQNGKSYLLTRQAFIDMNPEKLRSLLENDIRRSNDVKNHLKFADQLGSDWTEIASQLRRIP